MNLHEVGTVLIDSADFT